MAVPLDSQMILATNKSRMNKKYIVRSTDQEQIVASSVGHFLTFVLGGEELGAENWPYGEEQVTTADPDIRRFHGVPLPWNV